MDMLVRTMRRLTGLWRRAWQFLNIRTTRCIFFDYRSIDDDDDDLAKGPVAVIVVVLVLLLVARLKILVYALDQLSDSDSGSPDLDPERINQIRVMSPYLCDLQCPISH